MSASYLCKRGTRFHVRLFVPADLIPAFGRSEIHRSLRVSDPRQARSMARSIAVKAEQAFADLRQQQLLGASPEALTVKARGFYAEQLPVLRRGWVRKVAYGAVGGNGAPQTGQEAIKAFCADKAAVWEPKTQLMHKAALDLFVQIVGDKPIPSITRADCRTFRDTLAKLPPNKGKRFPGMTISQVLETRPEPMSPKNVNRVLSAVSGLFSWCERERLISESPARGLMLRINRRADTERNVFSPDQLRQLFSMLDPSMGAKFWLPAIGLSTPETKCIGRPE